MLDTARFSFGWKGEVCRHGECPARIWHFDATLSHPCDRTLNERRSPHVFPRNCEPGLLPVVREPIAIQREESEVPIPESFCDPHSPTWMHSYEDSVRSGGEAFSKLLLYAITKVG